MGGCRLHHVAGAKGLYRTRQDGRGVGTGPPQQGENTLCACSRQGNSLSQVPACLGCRGGVRQSLRGFGKQCLFWPRSSWIYTRVQQRSASGQAVVTPRKSLFSPQMLKYQEGKKCHDVNDLPSNCSVDSFIKFVHWGQREREQEAWHNIKGG